MNTLRAAKYGSTPSHAGRETRRDHLLGLQGALTCSAQKEGDLASSGPVTFLLDYAASLGITKDITKTQAYSVWLQGVACALSSVTSAVHTCKTCSLTAPCGESHMHVCRLQELWWW